MTRLMASRKHLLRPAALWVFVLIAFSSVRAETAITFPQAYPDLVFAGTTTQVTVMATIPADQTLLANSINLIRLDALGHNKRLGRLYDDGTHGDEHAGDSIYSGQISLNETQVGDIKFVVSAAYRSSLKRVSSTALVVTVAKRPSPEELKKNFETQESAARSFRDRRKQIGDDRARAETVSALRKQPNVADAGIASDGTTIWIRYRNGLEAVILGGRVGTMGGAASPFNFFAAPTSQPSSGSLDLDNSVSCSCADQKPDSPKVKPRVLAPFFDSVNGNDPSDKVAASLARTCLDPGSSTRVLKNGEVTLDTLKTLYQYNVVFLNTHGGIDQNNAVMISTRERYTQATKDQHLADWQKGRIIPGTIADGSTYWSILPNFVNYYSNGRFKNALVYMSACDTFGDHEDNLTMANAFINNGAVSYFGWRKSVSFSLAGSMATSLFNTLTDPKLEAAKRSTGSAFDKATSDWWYQISFWDATFKILGRNLVLNVPSATCPRVVVSTSLQILPKTGPYTVGQQLNGSFSITNRGSADLVMNKVLIGGRVGGQCPNNVCPDFTPRTNIKLTPGQTYSYTGAFTPSVPGSYALAVAYQKPDGSWVMPVDSEKGTINKLSILVQTPPPKLTGHSPTALSASPNAQTVFLQGSGLAQILYCYVQYPDGKGTFIYIPLAQVTGRSNERLETRIKFAVPGTYYISAFTMDGGRSNALPITVH